MDNRLKLEAGRDALEEWLTGPMRAVNRDAMSTEAVAMLASAEQDVSIAVGKIDRALRYGVDEAIDANFVRHGAPLTRWAAGAGAIIDNATGALVE